MNTLIINALCCLISLSLLLILEEPYNLIKKKMKNNKNRKIFFLYILTSIIMGLLITVMLFSVISTLKMFK